MMRTVTSRGVKPQIQHNGHSHLAQVLAATWVDCTMAVKEAISNGNRELEGYDSDNSR
jgi:hypothetical protein